MTTPVPAPSPNQSPAGSRGSSTRRTSKPTSSSPTLVRRVGPAADFVSVAQQRGLRIFAVNQSAVRLVWHLDVDDADTVYAADLVNTMLAEAAQGA